jgi:hypothetical protein
MHGKSTLEISRSINASTREKTFDNYAIMIWIKNKADFRDRNCSQTRHIEVESVPVVRGIERD